MKSTGNLRSSGHFGAEEVSHKATKLPPLKKSGKERHSLYRELDQADEDDDLRLLNKRESALDYYDDEDTEELWDDEDTEDQWEEEDEDDADDLSEDWADEEDESWNDEDGETDDWKE
jgi:hypothetical protein